MAALAGLALLLVVAVSLSATLFVLTIKSCKYEMMLKMCSPVLIYCMP